MILILSIVLINELYDKSIGQKISFEKPENQPFFLYKELFCPVIYKSLYFSNYSVIPFGTLRSFYLILKIVDSKQNKKYPYKVQSSLLVQKYIHITLSIFNMKFH